MVVLEELVDLGRGGVVDLLEAVDLLFEEFPLSTPDLVLVDDVDCTSECGLVMDGLPELVELVLLEAGGEELIVFFNTAFDFSNEIDLLKLELVLPPLDLDRAVLRDCLDLSISH